MRKIIVLTSFLEGIITGILWNDYLKLKIKHKRAIFMLIFSFDCYILLKHILSCTHEIHFYAHQNQYFTLLKLKKRINDIVCHVNNLEGVIYLY